MYYVLTYRLIAETCSTTHFAFAGFVFAHQLSGGVDKMLKFHLFERTATTAKEEERQ